MGVKNYGRWDFGIFILLTALAVVNGQTTIFYIIYFFLWNEFIRVIVDRLLYKKNSNALLVSGGQDSMFGNLFLMGIYFVFIVVFLFSDTVRTGSGKKSYFYMVCVWIIRKSKKSSKHKKNN